MALEHYPDWEEMSQNHKEGRTGDFFCCGDECGDELDEAGRPKMLQHKACFNLEKGPFNNERDAYAPLVWQCRYGGKEVPDQLWMNCTSGKGRKYSENQAEYMVLEQEFMKTLDARFSDFVEPKGKVKPGKYRAFGFEPPGLLLANVQDGIQYGRMMFGVAEEAHRLQFSTN